MTPATVSFLISLEERDVSALFSSSSSDEIAMQIHP
jgi:hypothetical protein